MVEGLNTLGDAVTGRAISLPNRMLRLEGAALLAAVVLIYARLDYAWWVFLLLLLAPDLSAVGYLAGNRIGSICYNAVHTSIVPLALAVAAWWVGATLGLQLALIWLAHIGMDRMLAYGLKYPDGFKSTHFDRV